MSKKISLEETGTSYEQTFPGLFRQSWKKFLKQKEEIKQNKTGLEKFDIFFCVLFNCYCQRFIYWREPVDEGAYVSNQNFSNIP